tara:strand:+ start:92 stop:463 length:372 start_codon:yes stop_codon:yes gene_type:complete
VSLIYIGFGGFIGALARYSFNLIFGSILGLPVPLATIFVNILGSFLMGIIFYFTSNNPSEFYKLFFMTGILGSFTTFSAFSLDSINMFFEKEYLNLFLYISISVFLSIFSLYLGFVLSRFISS